MITEVDEALSMMLGASLPEGTLVRLDPPRPIWESERPGQAVDLFLFDVHNDGAHAESRRYALSYLVTARAPDLRREHLLLDVALRTLIHADSVPASCLPQGLAASGETVCLRVADSGPGGLWANLGMPARAAFVVVVSVVAAAAGR